MDTKLLEEVAEYIGATQLKDELELLTSKAQSDCPLVLPLVGEFSAGKTTLINALTDNKQLETGLPATTSTIYEVVFGEKECFAEVYSNDGNRKTVEDISSLHNAAMKDANIVVVHDTSKTVPSSIVLVDTPGLDSADPRHKEALVRFLPQADGILLVVDIQQPSITKSLSDFLKTMGLSTRRMYVILTKADTKSTSEIAASKKSVSKESGIPESNIVVVSVQQNKTEELTTLLDTIQHEKAGILEQINRLRMVSIAEKLVAQIKQMREASVSDTGLDDAIREQERKRRHLESAIKNLMDSIKVDVDDKRKKTKRDFEDILTSRLNSLNANQGADFNAQAVDLINSTATRVVSNLRADIQNIIRDHALKQQASNDGIAFHSLDGIDFSKLTVDGLPYHLDLNRLGHEHDGHIATGLTMVAAAVLVYFAPEKAGVAVATQVGQKVVEQVCEKKTEQTTKKDDVKNTPTKDTTQQANEGSITVEKVTQAHGQVQKVDQLLSKTLLGTDTGVVKPLVGIVTDKAMGEPQRRRAVRSYMESTLMPAFESKLGQTIDDLLHSIQESLYKDSADKIDELKKSMQDLKEKKQNKESEFRARVQQMNMYSQNLQQTYLCGNF